MQVCWRRVSHAGGLWGLLGLWRPDNTEADAGGRDSSPANCSRNLPRTLGWASGKLVDPEDRITGNHVHICPYTLI